MNSQKWKSCGFESLVNTNVPWLMEENPLMEKMDDEVKMKKLCVRILPKFLKKSNYVHYFMEENL